MRLFHERCPREDPRLRSQVKRLSLPDLEVKRSLEERLVDEARFFKAWMGNPKVTGAVSPSGRFLARMMARYVEPDSTGPIIELGPGTGPVTQALLHRGIAPERLVLIEFDPHFCKLLARRFPRCRIVQGDAYNLADTLAGLLEEPAAAVVSSLPLLTRPEADRVSLLRQSFDLMQPDGRFIQFTYGMVSPMPGKGKRGAYLAYDAESSPPVWLNLPPARVWIYRPAGCHVPVRKIPSPLIVKLKEQTARARRHIELHRLRMSNDPALKPALALLRRIGEPKKPHI